ncbi:MBOAT family O-acyltransferase [Tumidithrix helvetica PCC 7403]|uniref:MBOAT family O-acyltransferase n=1 Tax=Tumidithrix helvetica TaxID=3457545 RepID=UPI003C950DAB
MDFLSLEYGSFLISIAIIYWLIPHLQTRLLVLLTASLLFYSLIQVQYVWLLIVMTGVNFWLGAKIKTSNYQLKRWLLFVGVSFNVLLLVGFKYIPFLLSIVASLTGLSASNAIAEWVKTSIVAPITLSFFVFEMIAYLVDIFRGGAPAKDFLSFVTYKTFFAKILSGPIVRFHEFAPQLASRPSPKLEDMVDGVWLITSGAIKKGIVADNMARYVDLCFRNMERAGSVDLWLALFGFGLQIYFDFSGYIDMARGSALLLGFKLPQNFDFPYFAGSISDFWRRWHITLGDWMRNYVYIPLGGSRKGLFLTCVNLMIIMLIVGIWHGANWGFIIWGAWHGMALALHRIVMVVGAKFERLMDAWKLLPMQIVAIALTQLIVLIGWIPFRLPNFADTNLFLQRMWGRAADPQFGVKIYVESLGMTAGQIALLMMGIVGVMFLLYRCDRARLQFTWQVKLFLVPISLYLVGLLGPEKNLPFIYFDF